MYREQRIPPGEAQRILARALELQRVEGGGRDMSDGEIARTLAEIGVEERFVRQAMDDDGVDPADVTTGRSWFTGTPLHLAFERRVGRSVSRDDHTRVVGAIRRAADNRGQAEIVGDEITWTMQRSTGRRRSGFRVIVSPSVDGTKVRVEEDLRGAAGGIFGGVLGGVGANVLVWAVLLPALFGAPIGFTFLLVGVFFALYAILRVSFGAYVRARRKRLLRVAEKVAAEIATDRAPSKLRIDATARTRIDDAVDASELLPPSEEATSEEGADAAPTARRR